MEGDCTPSIFPVRAGLEIETGVHSVVGLHFALDAMGCAKANERGACGPLFDVALCAAETSSGRRRVGRRGMFRGVACVFVIGDALGGVDCDR